VAKGAVYLIFQSVLGYLFSLVFYVLVARVLGPSDVGKLSVLLTVNAVFSLTGLSVSNALQKFIPTYVEAGRRGEVGEIISAGLMVVLPVSGTALAVLTALSERLSLLLFGSALDGWLIVAILLASFLLTLTAFLGGGMLGFGMFRETAAQNVLNSGVSRLLALVLAAAGLGLMGVMLGWLVAGVATLAFSLYLLRHNLALKKGFPVSTILEFSLPVHFFTVITFVQGWADIALLYALARNLEQIGIYYLVVSGAAILSFLYAPIIMAFLPALSSRYTQGGSKAMEPMADTYIRLTFKILVPIGGALAALSPTAIEAAFGAQYVSGAIPFAMLTATSIITALALLMVTILQGIGNTRPLIVIGITASMADIALVATLASSFAGVAGASGRIAFSAAGVILGYYYVRSKIKLRITRGIRQPLIAAVTIAAPLYLADQYLSQVMNLTLRAPVDILGFVILAIAFTYFTGYLTKEDFATIRQATPRRLAKVIDVVEGVLTRRELRPELHDS